MRASTLLLFGFLATGAATDTLGQGVSAVVAQDYNRAEPLLKKALSEDPNLREGHYNLGVVYRETNRFEAAVSEFKTALPMFDESDRPNREKCLYGIALAEDGAQNFERAADAWNGYIAYARRFAGNEAVVQIAQQNRAQDLRLANIPSNPSNKASR